MKIIFIRAYDFPLGGASQNRLLGICRGLIEQGHHVEVHQFAPAKLDLPENHVKSQVYKLVQIYNHAWKWSPTKSVILQYIGLIEGMIKTCIAILKSKGVEHIDYVFINSEKNIFVFPFFIIAKLIGARLGRDLNEYPLSVLLPEKFNKLQKKYKRLTNYRWFDVLFVITNNLGRFYRPFTKKKVKFLHLPMTVDFDRFPHTVKRIEQPLYITYCGDLSQDKDGVLSLIKSFALIRGDYPEIKLKLIGHNNNTIYLDLLKNLILDLGLLNNVVLTGYVHPDKIPEELYNSRLLLLSRPDNIQAQGGFPTKLGEYLACGVPVVVTSVGELPNYLEEGQNAFVAEPNSVESFAKAMKRALSNEQFASKIGLEGRKTALLYFSHTAQGVLVSEFLKMNK